jgi:radical SAM-linked protein
MPPLDMTLLETKILPHVFKPGRYLGLEQGAFRKDFDSAKATLALTFPDLYEIGSSSYAIKLLYSVVNNHPDYLCDRVYAPAKDFWQKLTEFNLPLFAVESKRPVKDFDLMAISLQYELNYTTILGELDACQIPLRSQDRLGRNDLPLILGGGPGSSNPMPLVPFFDGFMVGDGEELLIEVLDLLADAREKGWGREEKLSALANISGVFVPHYNDYAYKRVVDIAQQNIDIAPLIPAVEAVHDRVTVEARRGCDRMCRFCHPAFINLPARENDVDKIKATMLKQLAETGYEECSLLSLSIADYSQFKHLVQDVAHAVKEEKASLSLSSQRADRFSLEVAEAVQSVRKSTLTFAPEAGTLRLRDVINKNLSDDEILKAVTTAYTAGWNKVKLYFMIGLPTETQSDLDGIIRLLYQMQRACVEISKTEPQKRRKPLELNVTLSNFVPKPHTPFQWHPQDTVETLNEKIGYLKTQFKKMRGVKASFTTPTLSKLEAVISKGDERLADVIELAYRNGAYLDAWDETKPFAKWFDAMQSLGIDEEAYTRDRLTHPEDPLPWDVIHMGLDKAWLKNEWERSKIAASTTPCFDECSLCGVCTEFGIWPTFTKALVESDHPPDTETEDEATGLGILPAYADEDPEAKADSAIQRLTPDPVMTLRFTWQKKGSLKYIGHLDWMRLIQRAVRLSKLPVAYTKGYNPRSMLSFAPALPLFVEGLAEIVDLSLYEPTALEGVLALINPHMPEDAQIIQVEALPAHAPSIEKMLQSMHYFASTPCVNSTTGSMIREQLKTLAHEPHWMVNAFSKKRGAYTLDIKPYVRHLQLETHPSEIRLHFHVERANPLVTGGTLWIKPDWVLQHLAPEHAWHVTRQSLALCSLTPSQENIISVPC